MIFKEIPNLVIYLKFCIAPAVALTINRVEYHLVAILTTKILSVRYMTLTLTWDKLTGCVVCTLVNCNDSTYAEWHRG